MSDTGFWSVWSAGHLLLAVFSEEFAYLYRVPGYSEKKGWGFAVFFQAGFRRYWRQLDYAQKYH